MSGRIWTISNALSFLRVVLVFPIAVFVRQNTFDAQVYAVGLIIVAAFTDLFDGALARKLNQVSELGKIIDPAADKIAVGLICILLVLQKKLSLWFVLLVLIRDLLILLGGMYVRKRKGITLQSNVVGKWAVTFVTLYILFAIVNNDGVVFIRNILLAASAGALLLSFGLYAKRFADVLGKAEN